MTVMGKFDGYTLREIEEKDYAQLEKWIASDPVHNGILDPEFFMGEAINEDGELGADPRVSVFALADRKQTLMYIRLSRVSRVHIQFPPEPKTDGSREKFSELHKHRKEMVNALVKGMAFLEVGLARAGCAEWIFESESQTLRNTVEKRMGFVPSPQEMVRVIPRAAGEHAATEPLRTVPQQPKEEA